MWHSWSTHRDLNGYESWKSMVQGCIYLELLQHTNRRTPGCKCLLQATINSAQQSLALERRKYTRNDSNMTYSQVKSIKKKKKRNLLSRRIPVLIESLHLGWNKARGGIFRKEEGNQKNKQKKKQKNIGDDTGEIYFRREVMSTYQKNSQEQKVTEFNYQEGYQGPLKSR